MHHSSHGHGGYIRISVFAAALGGGSGYRRKDRVFRAAWLLSIARATESTDLVLLNAQLAQDLELSLESENNPNVGREVTGRLLNLPRR